MSSACSHQEIQCSIRVNGCIQVSFPTKANQRQATSSTRQGRPPPPLSCLLHPPPFCASCLVPQTSYSLSNALKYEFLYAHQHASPHSGFAGKYSFLSLLLCQAPLHLTSRHRTTWSLAQALQ